MPNTSQNPTSPTESLSSTSPTEYFPPNDSPPSSPSPNTSLPPPSATLPNEHLQSPVQDLPVLTQQPLPTSSNPQPLNPNPQLRALSTTETSIKLFFDGCCKGNPVGDGATGFYLQTNQRFLVFGGSFIPSPTTNNVCEYMALIQALDYATTYICNCQHRVTVSIYGDSMLVINQLQLKWTVSTLNILPLFRQASAKIQGLKVSEQASVALIWIPREINLVPDLIANIAYRKMMPRCIPRHDDEDPLSTLTVLAMQCHLPMPPIPNFENPPPTLPSTSQPPAIIPTPTPIQPPQTLPEREPIQWKNKRKPPPFFLVQRTTLFLPKLETDPPPPKARMIAIAIQLLSPRNQRITPNTFSPTSTTAIPTTTN